MAPLKHEDRFLAEHNVDAALARSRYGRQPAMVGRKPTTTNHDDDADGDGDTGDLAGCFGVFDGHVNASASSYVERHMLRALLDQGADGRGAVLETCCTDAFRQVESSYRKMGAASPQSSLAKPDPKRRAAVGGRRSSACLPRCLFSNTAFVQRDELRTRRMEPSRAAPPRASRCCRCCRGARTRGWTSSSPTRATPARCSCTTEVTDVDVSPRRRREGRCAECRVPKPRTKWLTRCHSPDDPLEAKRLTDAGARLGRMRREGKEVGPMRSYPGGYAVSRAIGDFDAPHVVCTPE